MFSQACVKNSVHGRGLHPQGGSAYRGSASRGSSLGRPPKSDSRAYGRRAGATHPTGMHSCCVCVRACQHSILMWHVMWDLIRSVSMKLIL